MQGSWNKHKQHRQYLNRTRQHDVPVQISDDIMPGVVFTTTLMGPQPTLVLVNASRMPPPGASYNDLMGVSAIDELTGNAIFNGVRVHVRPVSSRETP